MTSRSIFRYRGCRRQDYCLRRAALLLNERVWVENVETAKGRAEHGTGSYTAAWSGAAIS